TRHRVYPRVRLSQAASASLEISTPNREGGGRCLCSTALLPSARPLVCCRASLYRGSTATVCVLDTEWRRRRVWQPRHGHHRVRRRNGADRLNLAHRGATIATAPFLTMPTTRWPCSMRRVSLRRSTAAPNGYWAGPRPSWSASTTGNLSPRPR